MRLPFSHHTPLDVHKKCVQKQLKLSLLLQTVEKRPNESQINWVGVLTPDIFEKELNQKEHLKMTKNKKMKRFWYIAMKKGKLINLGCLKWSLLLEILKRRIWSKRRNWRLLIIWCMFRDTWSNDLNSSFGKGLVHFSIKTWEVQTLFKIWGHMIIISLQYTSLHVKYNKPML